jgi:hypothetical protein
MFRGMSGFVKEKRIKGEGGEEENFEYFTN